MSENENAQQKSNSVFTLVIAVLAMGYIVGSMTGMIYAGYRNRQSNEKYRPSFERAKAELQELADKGCQVPFEDCRRPHSAVQRVHDAMDRENIAFGTRGVTLDKLAELEVQAEIRISSQKLAYLKANGGAKQPSDLELLEDICAQVYVYKRKLLPNHPTDLELKQLMPPGVTKAQFCHWGYN